MRPLLVALLAATLPAVAHAATPEVFCSLIWSYQPETPDAPAPITEASVAMPVTLSRPLRLKTHGFMLDATLGPYGDPRARHNPEAYELKARLTKDGVSTTAEALLPSEEGLALTLAQENEWAEAYCRVGPPFPAPPPR